MLEVDVTPPLLICFNILFAVRGYKDDRFSSPMGILQKIFENEWEIFLYRKEKL